MAGGRQQKWQPAKDIQRIAIKAASKGPQLKWPLAKDLLKGPQQKWPWVKDPSKNGHHQRIPEEDPNKNNHNTYNTYNTYNTIQYNTIQYNFQTLKLSTLKFSETLLQILWLRTFKEKKNVLWIQLGSDFLKQTPANDDTPRHGEIHKIWRNVAIHC